MKKVVLLGDSIFDNGVYVTPDPDVVTQLNGKLKDLNGTATLLAVDGSVTSNILPQIARVPEDTTHIFLSTGGNDALGQQSVLFKGASSVAEVIALFSQIQTIFRQNYLQVLEELKRLQIPVTVCTIYYPNFSDAQEQTLASTALSFFNDVIMTEASRYKFNVMEIRHIFTSPRDYANPIEPSAQGGDKMTDVMIRIIENNDFSGSPSIYY